MSGELDFQVRLELDRLKSDVLRVQQQFANIGNKAEVEGARIDRTFRRIGAGIAGYLGTQQLISFGRSIVDVRAEFEKFGIVLENTLGSKFAADNALEMVAEFAATTPFQLNELSDSFIRLTNQGFQPTRKELVKLGDLASSTGKGFTQLSEAIIDAQTGEFERLKEFGIKASKSGEDVTFTFKEQQTTIKNTASEIREYILSLGDLEGVAGANAKISASLSGQISNLGDAWDQMLNKIGSDNQGAITDAIGAAKYLIENYEDVAKILGVLIATYGAYKAAVIASVVAQKAAVLAGNVKAWFQLARSIKSAKDAQILFNLVAKANPYLLLASAIVGVVTALVLFSRKSKEASEAEKILADVSSEVTAKVKEESSALEVYKRRLQDTEPGSKERVRLIKELNKRYPDLLKNIDGEKASIDKLTIAMDSYISRLEQRIKLDVLESKLKGLTTQQVEVGSKFNQGEIDSNERYNQTKIIESQRNALLEELKYQKDLVEYGTKTADLLKEREKLNKELSSIPELALKFSDPLTIEEYKKQQKSVSKLLTDSEIEKSYSDYVKRIDETNLDYKNKLERLKLIDEELKNSNKDLGEEDEPGNDKITKTREILIRQKQELSKSYREMGFEVAQAEVDGMQEGLDKALAQAQLNHEKQLYEIEQQKAERLKKINEIEKLEGAKTSTNLPEKDEKYFKAFEKATKITYNRAIESAIKEDDKTLEAERERLAKMVEEFETFQQKRERIAAEYNKKITDLQAINQTGNYDENIRNVEAEKQQALADIDKELASREVSFKVWSERIANLGLEKLVQALETAKKLLESGNLDEKEKAILRAQISTLSEQVKLEEERKKQGLSSDDSWKNTLEIMNEVNQTVSDIIANFDGLDDATKNVLESAINVSSGIISMINGIQALSVEGINALKGIEKASAILTIASAAISVISSITGFFKKNKEAERAHQKALEEITQSKIAQQREYNKLLREQAMLMEDAVSIFGEKQIARAANFINVYKEAIDDYYKVLKGDAPTQKRSMWAKFFEDEYKKQQAAYNQGIGALANAKVVTGSKTVSSGFLGLGKKQKDVYSGLLDVYPDLIDSENRLNIERAQAILNSQKMSDSDKELIQTLISLEEEAKKAEEALESYLQETYGLLGNEIMNSLEEALRSGTDAWEDFGDAGTKVLEDLGKQITYSLFFADMFKELQDELKDIYSSGLSEEEIANNAASLIESFYNSIGTQMEDAQDFMANWDEQLSSFDLWSGGTREASSKGFASMSQDSADELNGRFTAIQGHTYEINAGVKILSQNSARMLELLGGIETNTKHLEVMKKDMHSLKVGMDNINTKGITIKS